MKGNNKHSKIVSQKEIQLYLDGKLSNKEAHALEKLALEDVFLQDALEGLGIKSANLDDVSVFDENLRTQKRKKKSSPWFVWTAVASVTAVTFGLFFYIQSGQKQELAFDDKSLEKESPLETHRAEKHTEILQKTAVEKRQLEEVKEIAKIEKKELAKPKRDKPVLVTEPSPEPLEDISFSSESEDEGLKEFILSEDDYLAESIAFLPSREMFSQPSIAKEIVLSDNKKSGLVSKKQKSESYKSEKVAFDASDRMEVQGDLVDLKRRAFNNVKNAEWEEALENYKTLEHTNGLDNEIRFYRSVAYIHQNRANKAIIDLVYLLKNSGLKKDAIQWYLAMAYSKSGKKEESVKLFKTIVSYKSSDYHFYANSLLNK